MTKTTLLLSLLVLTSLACRQRASHEAATPATGPAATSEHGEEDAHDGHQH